MKTFKNISVYDLISAIGAINHADENENPELREYISEATTGFINEWVADEIDENEVDMNQVKDDIYEAVYTKIEQNVGHSMFVRVLNAVEAAISQSLDRADVPHNISINEKKGALTISVGRTEILRAWRQETQGQGMVSWDNNLTADDITNAKMLVNILRHRDQVYGGNMNDTYDGYFSRAEPDTGSYVDLDKVARKAHVKAVIERGRVRRAAASLDRIRAKTN